MAWPHRDSPPRRLLQEGPRRDRPSDASRSPKQQVRRCSSPATSVAVCRSELGMSVAILLSGNGCDRGVSTPVEFIRA